MNNNLMNINTLNNTLTMSSFEIAELTGKRHDNVMRDIRVMLEKLEIDETYFCNTYKDSAGRTFPCYYLNLKLTSVLISGYSVKARNKLIDKMPDMVIFEAIKDFDFDDIDPDMYVYAIKEKESGRIKIGISRNPAERLKQLQVGNSQTLELIATKKAENRFLDERQAHIDNKVYHIRSEWFDKDANIYS